MLRSERTRVDVFSDVILLPNLVMKRNLESRQRTVKAWKMSGEGHWSKAGGVTYEGASQKRGMKGGAWPWEENEWGTALCC